MAPNTVQSLVLIATLLQKLKSNSIIAKENMSAGANSTHITVKLQKFN